MEVGLGPGHIVLDGDPAHPRKRAQQPPTFRSMSIVAKRSPISATAEHFLRPSYMVNVGCVLSSCDRREGRSNP